MTNLIWAMTDLAKRRKRRQASETKQTSEKRQKQKTYSSTEMTLYRLGLAAILVVAAAVFFIRYFKISFSGPLFACPIHSLTGLFCPGCGGTRAFSLLFRGRLVASFLCHPLVLYGMAVFGVFMISHTLRIFTKGRIQGMTYRHIYIKIAVALLILNVIVKNAVWLCFRINLIEWAVAL